MELKIDFLIKKIIIVLKLKYSLECACCLNKKYVQ